MKRYISNEYCRLLYTAKTDIQARGAEVNTC